MKALNYLVAFVGGAAIGAACGMLFAPERGSDLREKIAEALRKRGIRLNRQELTELVDEIAEEIQTSKDEA
ncbi:MAG: YtxH domain-containing protein [Prevotellaceae bacterium]|nr:YtxH domain-containing protein [Prevotellaceae bacterium]